MTATADLQPLQPTVLQELDTAKEQYRNLLVEKREALRPYVDAFKEIDARLGQFDGATVRPRATTTRPASTGTRRGRQGDRLPQFLQAVASKPGATIPEIAELIGNDVSPNYLYRVRDRAVEQGLITVNGTQIFPSQEREAELANASRANKNAAK